MLFLNESIFRLLCSLLILEEVLEVWSFFLLRFLGRWHAELKSRSNLVLESVFIAHVRHERTPYRLALLAVQIKCLGSERLQVLDDHLPNTRRLLSANDEQHDKFFGVVVIWCDGERDRSLEFYILHKQRQVCFLTFVYDLFRLDLEAMLDKHIERALTGPILN